MAEYREIIYEKQRGGVLITLNRPEAMNAISRNLIKELHTALDEVETPGNPRRSCHRRWTRLFRRQGPRKNGQRTPP
jgi:hypothetical protein